VSDTGRARAPERYITSASGARSLNPSIEPDRRSWREPAGFAELTSLSIESPFPLPSVDEYLAFLRAAAAPVRAVLSRLSQPVQDAAWQEIREQLSANRMDVAWVGPNTLRLTVGKR
jgi:hypothetical protein